MSTPHANPAHDPDDAAMARPGRGAALAGLLCAALLALAAAPAILLYLHTGRGAFDEINFHEPAIRTFAQAWPKVDLSDYLSATTPGYHLLMAGLLRLLGESGWILRAANLLIAGALVGLLGAACALRAAEQRHGGVRPCAAGVMLALPMVGSMYVLASGIWLLPDNLGWLLVLAVTILSLRLCREQESGKRAAIGLLVLAGAALAALVFVRQIHLWAAAPIWAAAWLSGGSGPIFGGLPQRAGRTLAAAAATLPAFLLIAWFARLWGGLTPPTFHAHFRISPAAPALVLALIGVYSVFFLPVLLPPLAALRRERRWALPAAAALGLLAAAIPETTHSMAEGRWTGIWSIARVFEERGLMVADRSLFMAALSVLGAVCLAGWVRRAGVREGLVALAALAAFAAAQAASAQLWQRYSEPFILMLLALLAARGGPAPDSDPAPAPAHAPRPLRPIALAGPALLAALLLAQGYLTFARAEPVDYFGFTPGGERIRRFFAGDIPEPIQRPPRP